MNWAAFIGPLLTAKLSLVVLIGQLFIYSLIFEHVKTHEERLYEVLLFSVILWVGYVISAVIQYTTHNNEVHKLERYSEEMLTDLEEKHLKLESNLKKEISDLKLKFEEIETS